MRSADDDVGEVRRRILAVKDDVIALTTKVNAIDAEAGLLVHRARLALFEAWTLLVGPPEEDEDD